MAFGSILEYLKNSPFSQAGKITIAVDFWVIKTD